MLKLKQMELVKLTTSIAVCLFAGGIGYIYTMESIQTWYVTLEKPVFTPFVDRQL